MDFESMVGHRTWPVRPVPSMHNQLEHPEKPMFYHQDHTGTDLVHRQRVLMIGGDTSDFKNKEDQRNADLEDAALWPAKSLEIQCYTPYFVSGLLFFWVIPQFLPQLGVGENVLAAYGAGGITYYLKNSGNPQVKKS